MATRKHRKSRKSAKRFRRTRSKRQRGGTRDEDIIKAIEDGDTETVTTLMKQKDDDLIIAIYEGDIKTVEMLLKTGSDVNAIDDNGWSALYLASMNGHTDIVAILLENGALPIMSEAEFQECEKQKDEDTGREWVECSISLDEINRFQTVKPLSDPPNNNKVCFKRSALQRWLAMKPNNPTNPAIGRNAKIDKNWVKKWYPLGLYTNYDDITGGKRKTRKSKKSKKSKRKTRK